MKINNFRGDLTDISAKKEALTSIQRASIQQTFRTTIDFGEHRYDRVRTGKSRCNESFCVMNELCHFRYFQCIRCIGSLIEAENRDLHGVVTSASFFEIKEFVFRILWSRKYIFLIMKINIFRGDPTDISAKKEALMWWRTYSIADEGWRVQHGCMLRAWGKHWLRFIRRII